MHWGPKTLFLLVDRVILATGVENDAASVYGPILDQSGVAPQPGVAFQNSNFLTPVTGTIPTVAEPTGIAKRLVGPGGPIPPQDIFFHGPAAGPLAGRNELSGVEENFVSTFLTGSRTRAHSDAIGAQLVPGGFQPFPQAPRPPFATSTTPPAQLYVLVRAADRPAPRAPGALDDLYVRARLVSLLAEFTLPKNLRSVEILITRLVDGKFAVEFEPTFSSATANRFRDLIQGDPDLVDLIAGFIGQGPRDQIRVRIPILASRNPDAGNAQLDFRRSSDFPPPALPQRGLFAAFQGSRQPAQLSPFLRQLALSPTPQLVGDFLRSTSVAQRRAGAQALVRLPGSQRAALILRGLRDPDVEVRRAAARATEGADIPVGSPLYRYIVDQGDSDSEVFRLLVAAEDRLTAPTPPR